MENSKIGIGQNYVLSEYKLTVEDMTGELIMLRAYVKQLEEQLRQSNEEIDRLLNEQQKQ